MKKGLFLTVMLLIVLTVVSAEDNGERIWKLLPEYHNLHWNMITETITEKENQRLNVVYSELITLYGITNDQLAEQKETGQITGWPSTTVLQNFGFPNLKQPTGTKSSYIFGVYGLEIIIADANASTLQDIKRQVERISGEQMLFNNDTRTSGFGTYTGIMPRGNIPNNIIDLKLVGNQLEISLRWNAG